MSEILTIDTTAGLQQTERIEPLRIYGEEFSMLGQRIPEYTGGFPAPAMVNLAKRLKMTMKLYAGLGLAANQCGVAERMFVIGTDDYQMVCINPKIITSSANYVKEPEGCLSFPGLYLKIIRSSEIDVEYTTENGEVKKESLTGVTARCFLHEFDHMNGIKFIQHVGPLALKLAKQKQQKMIKTIKRQKK